MNYKNILKKTPIIIIIIFCLISSCSKEDVNEDIQYDEPGVIAGLGETEGVSTGTPFALPYGILLANEITGYDGFIRSAKEQKKSSPIILSEDIPIPIHVADTMIGSGYYVKLFISLKSTLAVNKVVEFPAGLIINSKSPYYQNGILLKTTKITVPRAKTYKIVLLMYCGNNEREPSSPNIGYEWGVVSNSSLIKDLCKRLKNKKINYEEFNSDDEINYYEQRHILQELVWNLTDYYNELSDYNIQWINDLPTSLIKE